MGVLYIMLCGYLLEKEIMRIFHWREIYKGMSYEEFIRIENLMQYNQIQIKTRIKSLRNRITNDAILGGNPLILNDSMMKTENREYKIMVKKTDIEKAQYLLYKK